MQGDRPTVGEPGRQAVEPEARRGAHGMDRRAAGDRLDPGDGALDVGGEVGLVEDHDRLGARAPGDGEVALQPTGVELVVERGHDQQQVDVGRQDLLGGAVIGRRAPDDRRAAGRRAWTRRWSGSPVGWSATQSPTTGKSGSGASSSASNRNRPLSVARASPSGRDQVRPAVLDDHPARLVAGVGVRGEGRRVARRPSPSRGGVDAGHRDDLRTIDRAVVLELLGTRPGSRGSRTGRGRG